MKTKYYPNSVDYRYQKLNVSAYAWIIDDAKAWSAGFMPFDQRSQDRLTIVDFITIIRL